MATMLRALLRYLLDRLGERYPRVMLAAIFPLSFLVVLVGVWLLDLYVELVLGPVLAHPRGHRGGDRDRDRRGAVGRVPARPPGRPVAARRAHAGDRDRRVAGAGAGLPLDLIRYARGLPILLNVVPIAVYLALEIGGPFVPAVLVLAAGVGVVVAYSMFLRFFAVELALRPLVERDLAATSRTARTSGARPCRCGGGCSSGCRSSTSSPASRSSGSPPTTRACARSASACSSPSASRSRSPSSCRCSCCARSWGRSRTCRPATSRVAAGDFSTRVPVVGSDETGPSGRLVQPDGRRPRGARRSCARRSARSSIPALADRVLAEGNVVEGEEVEVTVLFVDIRDFTSFAERSSAREVVAELNRFYDYVVPLLSHHGGHANKFVGDGLLGVFGAPDRPARPRRPRDRRGAARSPRSSARRTRATSTSASASTRGPSSPAPSAAAGGSSSP